MESKDPGHFILRAEDYNNLVIWLANHRHKFLCDVYDRVEYAFNNNKENVKLWDYTYNGKILKRYNIKLSKLLEGDYLKNTMLKYFEYVEHYDKCKNIVTWLNGTY
tara:strand:+ start:219 stop:536 length:318 start_codon:yes stop_codon:yes gene_type:complete